MDRFDVDIASVHDGDTVTLNVKMAFGRVRETITVPIRMGGINAPELATDAGKAALKALTDFIGAHPGQFTAQSYGNGADKYGRWLATLYAPDGTDVCAWMLANGWAVPDSGRAA